MGIKIPGGSCNRKTNILFCGYTPYQYSHISAYVFSNYVVSTYIVSNYVVSTYVVSTYVVMFYAVSTYVVSTYVIKIYVFSTYVVSNYLVSIYVFSTYVVMIYSVSTYVVSTYVVSNYVIAMYVVSNYVVPHLRLCPRIQHIKPSAQICRYVTEDAFELLNYLHQDLTLHHLVEIQRQSTLREAEEHENEPEEKLATVSKLTDRMGVTGI